MPAQANNRILERAIIASQFAPPFMFSGVAVVLPSMGADLHAGATSLGLIESLFLASQLSLLLAMGRLADSSDKRTLYKYGLLGFGAMAVAIGLLSNITAILVLRFLQGVTSAIFAATGPAILSEIVPQERRGRAYGSSIGSIYAGLTLGPLVAGYLNDHFGWRSVFLAGGVILLLAGLLVLRLMPSRWQKPPKGSVHLPSTALIISAALSLVAGSSLISYGLAGIACLLAGLALAVIFVRLQLRLSQPLLDIRALGRNRILSSALLVQFLLYVSAASTVFLLSLYIQVSLGHPAGTAGLVIAVGTVLMVVVAPLSGRLADHFQPSLVSGCGITCVLVSSLMGTTLNANSSLGFILAMFTLQGIGFAVFASPSMTTIMGSVTAEKASMASALGAKARSLGMMTGMLIMTLLIAHYFGNDPVSSHPERLADIPAIAYAILSLLTAAALLASLGNRNHMKR